MTDVLDPDDALVEELPPPLVRRERRFRRKARRVTVVSHRWLSLVLGLLLVAFTTAGAALVYAPEWTRWTNSAAYDVTSSADPVTPIEALDIVDEAHPDFHAGSINIYSGLIEIHSSDEANPGFYGVDPGSGRITGYVNSNRGVMAFLAQVHECLFSCPEYPGHLSFLEHPMPTLGMGWLKDVTVAAFLIGMLGLLLIALAVSGIWLWWPSIKRFASGFKVRLRRGRYVRDRDLHRVIGIVAVPFLLTWGITGASFEFHWVSTAWYAVTGGEQPKDQSFASAEVKGDAPDITIEEALAAAQEVAGPDKPLKNLYPPDPEDPTSAYYVYFSSGLDPVRYGPAPGSYEVAVDRHDASRTHVLDYGTGATASNKVLDAWGAGLLHYGQTVNPWWRTIWFAFGLTPLALAVTGVSTWLVKRRVRKARRQAAAEAAT